MMQNFFAVPFDHTVWFLAMIVWSTVWKGMALWKAARKNHQWWFIAFLVVNTLGVLEILYIYVLADKKFTFRKKTS